MLVAGLRLCLRRRVCQPKCLFWDDNHQAIGVGSLVFENTPAKTMLVEEHHAQTAQRPTLAYKVKALGKPHAKPPWIYVVEKVAEPRTHPLICRPAHPPIG